MPSLLVFETSFDPANNATWPNARRLGQVYCGQRLSFWLGKKDDYDNEYSAHDCVYRTLSDSNTGSYGLWIELKVNSTTQYVKIKKIKNKGNRIVCRYDHPTSGNNQKLVLTVAEDDDGNDKKMTVVIPEDRDRVIGLDPLSPATPYVVDVASDIDTIYDDGSGDKPKKAGGYVLSSVTFRRCA